MGFVLSIDIQISLIHLFKTTDATLLARTIRSTFPADEHFRRKHFLFVKQIYDCWNMSCFCRTNMGIDSPICIGRSFFNEWHKIARKDHAINFPGGWTLPVDTFSHFKENLDCVGTVMFLSCKCGPDPPPTPSSQVAEVEYFRVV